MSNQYQIYPISFAGGSTIDMTQIISAGVDPGSNVDEVVPAGQLIRQANILAYANPRFPVQTTDLDKVFTTVSPTTGYSCTSGGTYRAIQKANNGTFTGGSNNFKVVSGAGMLLPEKLQCAQNRMAILDMTYAAFSSDGMASPITPSTGQSFASAPSPAFNSQFYLGPCYVNGSQLTGLVGVRIMFGIVWVSVPEDGCVFPIKGHIDGQFPIIEFDFNRPDLMPSTLTNPFLCAAAGTIAIYLRRGAASGTRTADNATNHFKLSCSGGDLKGGSVTGEAQKDVAHTISALPTSSISVSVASNIP